MLFMYNVNSAFNEVWTHVRAIHKGCQMSHIGWDVLQRYFF